MHSPARIFAPVLAVALLAPMAAALLAPPPVPAGCVASDAADAAATLFHPGARIVEDGERDVAGLRTLLVEVPTMHPAVRVRMVDAAGAWCDARAGFNAAWTRAGMPADARAQAEAFAQLAGLPWFDHATVTSAANVGPIFFLRTHSSDNGVVAEWTILVGPAGVERATWTATGFAVAPFNARFPGHTALAGATHTMARTVDGRLADVEPVPGLADLGVAVVESVLTSVTMSDGFVVNIRWASTPAAPMLSQHTGVDAVDFIRITRDATQTNYETFLAWGLQKNWYLANTNLPSNTGNVYVDDQTALTCLACMRFDGTFNIHMMSRMVDVVELLGLQFADNRVGYMDVLGHEMFHNFQQAYAKERRGNLDSSAIEGHARAQETFHGYSWVMDTEGSALYGDRDAYLPTVSRGPAGRSYTSAVFWMSWFEQHGVDGVQGYFESSYACATSTGWAQLKCTLEGASGAPVDDDLARLARALLTGRNLTYGPAVGAGDEIDWSKGMTKWSPATFALGTTRTFSVNNGGMAGWKIAATGKATLNSGNGLALYVVHDDGASATIERIASGTVVSAPSAGASTWLVALYPGTGAVTGSVTYQAP